MTLPVSPNTITAANINEELGRAATAPFNINGAEERALAEIVSGNISFEDFYGKSAGGPPPTSCVPHLDPTFWVAISPNKFTWDSRPTELYWVRTFLNGGLATFDPVNNWDIGYRPISMEMDFLSLKGGVDGSTFEIHVYSGIDEIGSFVTPGAVSDGWVGDKTVVVPLDFTGAGDITRVQVGWPTGAQESGPWYITGWCFNELI